jgi:hypothetical protein
MVQVLANEQYLCYLKRRLKSLSDFMEKASSVHLSKMETPHSLEAQQ